MFYGLADGQCTLDSTSGCKTRQPFSNRICRALSTTTNPNTFEKGGWNSWGFTASVVNKQFVPAAGVRCFPIECGLQGDYMVLTISDTPFICISGQTLESPNVFAGTVTCPSNVRSYCQSVLACKDFCDSTQVCIRGTCRGRCPSRQFLSGTTCTACPAECQECSSLEACLTCPTSSNFRINSLCLTCPAGTTFSESQYVCSCNPGATCTPCGSYCRTCAIAGCTVCLPGFELKSGTCVSTKVCGANEVALGKVCLPCASGDCKECLLLYSSGLCVQSCPKNTQANANRTCEPCTNCSGRIDLQSKSLTAISTDFIVALNLSQATDFSKINAT